MVIASTDSARQGFSATSPSGSDFKPFSPQLTIPIGTRVSQVAFSADESYLAISAENGGGLKVYDVQALTLGNSQSVFELSTNGTSVRTLVPNPTSEKADLFALVTTTGELMIANMKSREFMTGPNGQVMKSEVSCIAWSTKGKQLVAGLSDGSALQITPEGEVKSEIPRPLGLENNQYGA